MIVFDLQCLNGHTFEGWFDNSAAYEEQRARNLINCPICGETDVQKVLSPVAIGSGKKDTGAGAEVSPEQGRDAVKAFREYVEKNYEDVGADFAKEALKIHYGVSEERSIRGTSTDDEEKTLRDEGISFFKVPIPRYDA